ncbi:uncharacterized protein LOC143636055 isoform X1 [Bidens hawaiensis]|uniref:uncharacterized protein LOC143636055 isoform X1 n=1 Tax=Bidens hawaiensis TaxID=980011 RepID=UPI00404AA4B9
MTWSWVSNPHEGYKAMEDDDSYRTHSYHGPPSPNSQGFYKSDNQMSFNQQCRNMRYQNYSSPQSDYKGYYGSTKGNHENSYQRNSQSQKRINCYKFEDDSEYDSEGSDTPSFVSYQEEDDYYYYHEHPQPIYEEVPQHYNHGGTYQRNYQQDQEDSSGNKEVSWKDVMDFLKEMKRDQEAHNQALSQRLELHEMFNDAQDKLVSQLLEEVAQIEREQEKLASGAMVDEEVIEEALDLSKNEFEDLVLENNTTPIPLVTEEPMNASVVVDDEDIKGEG